jgi:hypothetical protein
LPSCLLLNRLAARHKIPALTGGRENYWWDAIKRN